MVFHGGLCGLLAIFPILTVALPTSDRAGPKKVFMPSLCSNEGDPYCDPNWTPFPNMNNALMGYDIVNGDDMYRDGDPGFRSQIFGAVVTDDQGRMVLSDGISAVDLLGCESNFDSKTVTNLEEFKDSLSSSYDISADVSGSYAGYGAKFGYKDSGSAKQAKEKLQSGETAIMISEAECQLHKLRLNSQLLPDFTNQFIAALKELAAIKTSDSLTIRQTAYFKFFQDYGTHYITESRFGAKLIIQTEFSKTETSEKKMKEEERCRGLSMGFDAPFMSGEASANGCAGSSSDSTKANSNERSTSTITSIGSKPGDSAAEWTSQDFDWPQIVSMDLAPISNLFQTKYLSKYGIDANKIRGWFVPMDAKFCVNINARLPSAEKFPCSAPKGCGLNDKCGLGKLCVSGSQGAYTCDISPASAKEEELSLIVATENDKNNQARVYDLNDSSKTCRKLPPLPNYKLGWHSFVDVEGVPNVLSDTNVYEYNKDDNNWIVKARISTPSPWNHLFALSRGRMWAINVNWDRGNFIIEDGLARGGFKEVINDWNEFTVFPIGNDKFFVGAGKTGGSSTTNRARILDMNSGRWTSLPDVSGTRVYGSGGVIQSPTRGTEYLLAGGKSYKGEYITWTNIYNVRTRKWRNGPNIPSSATGNWFAAIPYQGSLIFQAGKGKILQFLEDSQTWAERPEMGVDKARAAIIKSKLC